MNDGDPEGTGGASPSPEAGENPFATPLPENVRVMLEENCGSCHGQGAPSDPLRNLFDLTQLLGDGWIVPGSPDTSPLVVALRYGIDEHLPGLGWGDDLETLVQFIDELEPDFARGCGAPTPRSFDLLHATLLADLEQQEPEARPFMRYVAAGYDADADCGSAADAHLIALIELVNSLSVAAAVVVPRIIQADVVAFAIDMRDYAWDRPLDIEGDSAPELADAWQSIVADVGSYAVEFVGPDADELRRQTSTAVPILFIDSFVHETLANNSYYYLTDAPAVVAQGVAAFVASVAAAPPVIMRAGAFGVESNRDRLVTRLARPGGPSLLWMLEELPAGTLRQTPVGAPFGGGKAMFALPNGFWGFALPTYDGSLASELPAGTAGSAAPRAKNPVTCLSCHSTGPRGLEDEVLAFAETSPPPFDSAELSLVRSQFLSPDAFQNELSADLRNAVAREDAGLRGPSTLPSVYYGFEEPLNAQTAVAELGVSVDELTTIVAAPGISEAIRALTRGAEVPREIFSAEYQRLLCAIPDLQNRPASCAASPQ